MLRESKIFFKKISLICQHKRCVTASSDMHTDQRATLNPKHKSCVFLSPTAAIAPPVPRLQRVQQTGIDCP